jgi:hypothetical protein
VAPAIVLLYKRAILAEVLLDLLSRSWSISLWNWGRLGLNYRIWNHYKGKDYNNASQNNRELIILIKDLFQGKDNLSLYKLTIDLTFPLI